MRVTFWKVTAVLRLLPTIWTCAASPGWVRVWSTKYVYVWPTFGSFTVDRAPMLVPVFRPASTVWLERATVPVTLLGLTMSLPLTKVTL